MRFLSRGLFTVALLGGLAFGSYAFGRYVLSSHLFGPKGAGLKQNIPNSDDAPAPLPKVSTAPATPATAPSKGSARVDVEILPADPEDDRALPPISSLERDRSDAPQRPPAPAVTSSPPISAPSVSNNSPSTSRRRDSVSDEASTPEENRPRRRKRRRVTAEAETPQPRVTRRRRTRRASSSATSTREAASRQDDAPARSDNDSNDAPRLETRDSSSDSSPTPRRRRRERVRDTAPSAPARRSDESPVPVPESGGGSDSPVPIPE